jgi:hypothetical protein
MCASLLHCVHHADCVSCRAQYRLVMKYLSEMTNEQTLVLYSGHPMGFVQLRALGESLTPEAWVKLLVCWWTFVRPVRPLSHRT